jgi:hypothetical protein
MIFAIVCGGRNVITKTTWRRGIKHQLGAENNATKFADSDIRVIRNSPLTNKWFADAYGVNITTIQRIRRRATWSHC